MDETAIVESMEASPEGKPEEKMLSVSRVNEIVKREKAEVAERVKRELEAKYAEEMAQQKSASPDMGIEQMSEKVYNRIAEEFAKQQKEAEAQEHKAKMENVASQYFLKMGKGKEMFEDFDDVMGDFEPASFPQVVFLASELENTPAVMYELSKNPQKLAAIDLMANKSPAKAKKMLMDLSESIAKNEQAKAENIAAPAPVSRLKSSTNVGTDTGAMTIRDLRKQPWLRG